MHNLPKSKYFFLSNLLGKIENSPFCLCIPSSQSTHPNAKMRGEIVLIQTHPITTLTYFLSQTSL